MQAPMKSSKLGELEVRIAGGRDGEGSGQGPVVVLLHGFGAPADDLVSLWRVFDVPGDTRWVFPGAPLALGPEYAGGRAWWPIDFMERLSRRARGDHGEADVPEGLERARTKVDALLAAVRTQLSPGKLVLGGFSQGAMLALDVALRTEPVDALLLLSGTQIAIDEWTPLLPARRGVPVFMSHGQQDEILPFAISRTLRDMLVAQGYSVEWCPFRGGHGIPPEVIRAANTFLRGILA